MGTLKLWTYQFMIEAMALTTIAAVVALFISVALIRILDSLREQSSARSARQHKAAGAASEASKPAEPFPQTPRVCGAGRSRIL